MTPLASTYEHEPTSRKGEQLAGRASSLDNERESAYQAGNEDTRTHPSAVVPSQCALLRMGVTAPELAIWARDSLNRRVAASTGGFGDLPQDVDPSQVALGFA